MAFPLLAQHLESQKVDFLRHCHGLFGTYATPRGSRKDFLIDELLKLCQIQSVHERLWQFLLTSANNQEIKFLIARQPPPSSRSTWGAKKADLIATVISADRPDTAQAQDDTRGSPASSQVPACGVLVPADRSPEVLKASLQRTWIKKARQRLKKEKRSILTRNTLRTILKANPAATVGEVQRQVEQATKMPFASGMKYKFFMDHLFRLLAREKGPTRRAVPLQKFRFDVSSKKVTMDTQSAEKHVAEQDAPLVSGVLVPWSLAE